MSSRARTAVFLLSLCGAARARAEVRSFEPGSVILPMDQCYQAVNGPTPTGWSNGACGAIASLACYNQGTSYPAGDIPHVFGLLYLLLLNNVPVSMTMKPDKLSLSDADFQVASSAGQPATVLLRYANGSYATDATAMNNGTNPVPYAGSAFIVDAAYTPRALAVIAAFNLKWSSLFGSVNLHLAQNAFTAPILTTLATRPKPAGIINGSGLEGYFQLTGIPNVVGNGDPTAGGAGNSYVLVTQSATGAPSYTWTAAPPGACDGSGNCTSFTYTPPGQSSTARILDVVWAAGTAVPNWSSLASNGLNQLLQTGGRLLATDQAAVVVENGASGSAALHYLTPAGLNGLSNGQSVGPYCAGAITTNSAVAGETQSPPQYPSSNPYLTVGNEAFSTVGNGQSSSYSFQGNQGFRAGVQALASSYKGGVFPVLVGHPTLPGATSPASGTVIYEGGGNAWNTSSFKDAGLHVMYDTLLNGGLSVGDDGVIWTPTELSHASPVADPLGTPKFYLGTFEWKVPLNVRTAGNTLWRPAATAYPSTLGHFRQYKGTASSSLSCAGGNCDWDAAAAIAQQGSRNIYVAVQQNGTWTLQTASSLQASDAALNYVMTNLGGKLGGIDYATAAVVQNKGRASLVTVANAPNRPTIAYVGAADGMIHAICVSSSCYGRSTGQEIWAVIPPVMRTAMQAAYNANDWSPVKVDGAIRVADSLDTFDPAQPNAQVYRTVLLVGMRQLGAVVALDISDPNPANLNQQGFRFLWQNDGTTVDATVTCPQSGCAMGPSQGASFAKPASTNTLLAYATSGVGVANQGGVNTYAMRLSDGKVMAFDQLLYSRFVALPAGGKAGVPNEVPALPTALDDDSDGIDETLYVTDYEGRVRRFQLSPTGMSGAATVLDASASCASGFSCQPISVSPAIARTGTPTQPAFEAIGATGGADWARSTATAPYYVFGIDGAARSSAAPIFQRSLLSPSTANGQLTNPLGETLPLRVYGQPTVSGSDLWVQATTLAVNRTSQLLQPILFPATAPQAYGQALRWSNVSTTLDATPVAFASTGGDAAVLVTGTHDAPGAVDVVSNSAVDSYALTTTSSSTPNQTYALTALGTQRMFKTISWFDLSE